MNELLPELPEEDYEEWYPVEPEKPAWKVYPESGFFAHPARRRACVEYPLNKKFSYAGFDIIPIE